LSEHGGFIVAEKRYSIVRRGIPCNFTFDPDAVQLLHEMVPSKRGYGRYLSELLRNERLRQEERERYQLLLAQTRAELLLKPTRLSEEAERACG
jgi:hypothetical protein